MGTHGMGSQGMGSREMGSLGNGRTRRELLRTGGVALVAATAVGCDLFSTEPESGGAGGGSGGTTPRRGGPKPKEAPMLAERVKKGELPPLESRLPDKPLQVRPVTKVGRYGGVWHNALLGPSNSAYIYCLTGYDQLLNWTQEWTGAAGSKEIKPNIAERYEVSSDGAVYTFWLRKGMRWSDGKPFTADDVVFAVDDVYLNKDLNPVAPTLLTTAEGKPARIEKVDSYAFKLTFPGPAGLFLQRLASPLGYGLNGYPRHYLEKFHKLYNPDADKLAKESSQRDWIALFQAKSAPWGENADLPCLTAWRLLNPFGKGTRLVVERNPYYWKVDPDGSQLPYLDQVAFEILQDPKVMLLKAAHGDIDLEVGPDNRFTTPTNKPVLARNRTAGHYDFLEVEETQMNIMVIFFNLAHKDPVKRAIFGDKDFRIGLSHAINRPELIKATLQRQGEPYQVAPLPDSPFYDKEFATQYLEYDVAEANRRLDSAGFTKKDSAGIRLGPDGEPIAFTCEFDPSFRPEWADMLDLIRSYWEKVGVKMQVKAEERSLWEEREAANQHDATVWAGGGGLAVLLHPRYYFAAADGSDLGVPWAEWYSTRGESGEKPPAAPLRQMRLYDKVQGTADPREQTRLMKQIMAICKEEFYAIGTVRPTTSYFIVGNNFSNVPQPMVRSWVYPTPGPSEPSQYFVEGDGGDDG